MVKALVAIGVILGSQILWMVYMMNAAESATPTTSGAYGAVWALGIPFVFLASLLVYLLIVKGK